MGSGSSVAAGLSERELLLVKQGVLRDLAKESSLARDASDCEDHKQEVLRLRDWIRDVNSIVQYVLKESAEASITAEEKNPTGADKAKESTTTLADGTKITTRSDGSRKQEDPDGTTIETWEDGRKLQTTPEGRTLECFPDGTKITKTEEGVMIVKRPNGSKLQKNADGTTIEVTKDGIMTQYNPQTKIRIVLEPDGTQTQTNEADGSMIQVFPDGTKIDTDPTGCRIVKYVDGRKVQRNPNGTVIESWEDGHKIQTKVDGSRMEIFPDGRKVQTMIDGTVIEQLKDGTQVRGLVGSYLSVKCSRCETIMSVPRALFVVSCRVCRNVMIAHKAQMIGAPDGGTLRVKAAQTQEEVEKDIRSIFDRFDVDNSNSICKRELGNMLNQLHFPEEEFQDLFADTDKNQDDALHWEEFLEFYALMQRRIQETAQAPIMAMTKDLLKEQQSALEAERKAVEQKHKELEIEAKTGNEQASAEYESSALLLQKLKEEYEAKTMQLKQTTDAKRARLKKRVEERKNLAARPNTAAGSPSRPMKAIT